MFHYQFLVTSWRFALLEWKFPCTRFAVCWVAQNDRQKVFNRGGLRFCAPGFEFVRGEGGAWHSKNWHGRRDWSGQQAPISAYLRRGPRGYFRTGGETMAALRLNCSRAHSSHQRRAPGWAGCRFCLSSHRHDPTANRTKLQRRALFPNTPLGRLTRAIRFDLKPSCLIASIRLTSSQPQLVIMPGSFERA